MSDSSTSGQREGTSGNGQSESDVESALRRRGLLATAATIGALSSAGCLGVLSERSETGPRSDDPTPAGTRTTTESETTTGTPQPTQRYDVEFVNQGATIDVPGDEALLYAGLDEDWDLPYQCERGICGQCTGKVDGDGTELVTHEGNEYLSQEQVEAGFVLTCVGYPEADFSIETDMQDAADSFTGGETETPSEGTETPTPTETYDIEFAKQGATIDVPGDEALLYAGLDEDWDLPYQCEHGVCGECTAKVDGDGTELVSHDGNRYLSEEQVEAGFVLTCVGYPEADFSIETDMKDEADQV